MGNIFDYLDCKGEVKTLKARNAAGDYTPENSNISIFDRLL